MAKGPEGRSFVKDWDIALWDIVDEMLEIQVFVFLEEFEAPFGLNELTEYV